MPRPDSFHLILTNNLLQNVINFTVWFALVFWAFLETRSVFVTGMVRPISRRQGICIRVFPIGRVCIVRRSKYSSQPNPNEICSVVGRWRKGQASAGLSEIRNVTRRIKSRAVLSSPAP